MPHGPVVTRTAEPVDVPVLVALWEELQQVGGRAERAVNPLSVTHVHDRLLELTKDPACRLLLACVEKEPAGMAVLRLARPDPLSDATLVQVAHLVVSRQFRHRGVGHALVAAAAGFAVERQVDHVAVGVYPSLRDASRFYARLGFAPAAVHRVAPVSVLRRRLGLDRAVAPAAEVNRRRTRLRRGPTRPVSR